MTTERTRGIRPGTDGISPERNAALRGASMAFGKPPVKPKPLVNTYSGTNGALAAASRAEGASRSAYISRTPSISQLGTGWEEHRLLQQRSGGSNYGNPYTPDGNLHSSHLDPSTGFSQRPGVSKSPSFIAATLAASRSVTPNHTGQQQQLSQALQREPSFTRRRSPGSLRSVSSRGSMDQPLDTSSIPPTTSLIGMFEQNGAMQAGKRSFVKRPETNAAQNVSQKAGRQIPPRVRTPSPRIENVKKPGIISPTSAIPPQPSIRPSETPKAAPSSRKAPIIKVKPEPPKQLQAVRKPPRPTTKPIAIPPQPQHSEEEARDDSGSSDDSFVSATEYKPSFRAELRDQTRRLASTSSHSMDSAAAIDSLANAIVASSLASSHAISPSRTGIQPPPPPPSRRPHNHNSLFYHGNDISRTPSPAKPGGLRTTMRKPKEETEDEGDRRRARKSLMKKHPNKHHEGDRKRWRNVVTERERKRYEAVWASNRGLYTPLGYENAVCSLVARDIYSRSRLHPDVLEEVYALVDRRHDGMLQKEEFVVGLWLIDQRLKGRKLPIRVTDSVWRSVGINGSIKVKNVSR